MGTPVACRAWAFALSGVLLIPCAPGGGAGTVLAQEQPQELQPAEQVQQPEEPGGKPTFEEEIQVTGSLIPRPTLEAMSPVTVLEPEEIAYRGITRLEDLLTTYPQVFVSQNSTVSNNATGTATVDLRNLGEVRTLVLVNGRRLPAGDVFATVADLNFIPAALVKRVDILTGGASTAYGADAVAGVVNFVLDTDFEGFRGGIEYGVYQHDNRNEVAQEINAAIGFDYPTGNVWDGDIVSANAAIGHQFADGRGHASVYLDYRHTEAVTKSERDYTSCSMFASEAGPYCGGSSTIPAGRFVVYDPQWESVLGDYVLDLPAGDQLRPRTSSDVYNYARYNYMQRPDERWSAGGFMSYELNEQVDVYAELMLMDDYTDAQIAPSGDFGNTEALNCDNPMLSPQQRALLCPPENYGPQDYSNVVILRRSEESGPRTSITRHTAWRLLAGLRGDLGDAWSYDLYGLYSETVSPAEYIGDLSVTRMADALDVIGDPDDPSTWECRSGNEGCAPWNIFEAGGVTQEALDYIMINMVLTSGTRTEMVSGVLNGDLAPWGLKLPAATEGIRLALGADYRSEMLYLHPDENFAAGNGSGQGFAMPRVDGSYDVAELYLEGLVPIVQDARGARDLSLELGYRYSDYNLAGSHPTWKAQLSYAPTEDLKLRGGVARATRAPNVVELFEPQQLAGGSYEDPCAGSEPTATLEQCVRTGVRPEQYGHIVAPPVAAWNNATWGGNPELDPETGDTLTFGIVLTPRGAPGLSTTLDYWDIQMEETIGLILPEDTVAACMRTGDPLVCSWIHRDAAGTLWLTPDGYVVATNRNVGELTSRGIDLNVSYLLPVGRAGILSLGLVGTYTLESSIATYLLESRVAAPIRAYDCAGYFGQQCGVPNPWWRHRMVVNWETTFDTVLSLGWRYIGPSTNDDASPDTDLADPGRIEAWEASGASELHAYSYLDLSATYNFTNSIQLTAGVNNVLDIEPPLGPGLWDVDLGPGFYGTYDPWGRFIYASLRFDF